MGNADGSLPRATPSPEPQEPPRRRTPSPRGPESPGYEPEPEPEGGVERHPHDDDEITVTFRRRDWVSMALGLKIKHKSSDECLMDWMKFLDSGQDGADKLLMTSSHLLEAELERILPVKPKYVMYCDVCEIILEESDTLFEEGTCTNCLRDLRPDLKSMRCLFLKFPIRQQLQLYLNELGMGGLIEDYEPCYRRLIRNCPVYERICEAGDIPLSVFVDTAQMTKKRGVDFHPALLSVTNIPVASQMQYPILAGLFCCRLRTPHFASDLLLSHLEAEFQDLERNGILWVRRNGGNVRSKVYLCTCVSDAKEKQYLLNQVSHSGYFSCPYCEEPGEIVHIGNFPRVWEEEYAPFRGTESKPGQIVGVKFPRFVHRRQHEVSLRSDAGRLQDAREVVALEQARMDEERAQGNGGPVRGRRRRRRGGQGARGLQRGAGQVRKGA